MGRNFYSKKKAKTKIAAGRKKRTKVKRKKIENIK